MGAQIIQFPKVIAPKLDPFQAFIAAVEASRRAPWTDEERQQARRYSVDGAPAANPLNLLIAQQRAGGEG